jgi:hypothetical protein
VKTTAALAFACVLFLALPARADDDAWTRLLKRHVDDQGLVDYKGWKASADDRKALDAVVASWTDVDEAKLSRDEKLALFVNAYNAITIQAMVEFYPLASIKDKVSVIGFNVWKDYKRKIAGQERSLDQIEHEVLRKMGEPRIHFAINCASLGCPVLRDEAYTAARIDEQLEDQVHRFLANPSKLKIEGSVVRLNMILKWFGDDFGGSDGAKLAWLAKHATDPATKKALVGNVTIEYLDYDWSLNEKK